MRAILTTKPVLCVLLLAHDCVDILSAEVAQVNYVRPTMMIVLLHRALHVVILGGEVPDMAWDGSIPSARRAHALHKRRFTEHARLIGSQLCVYLLDFGHGLVQCIRRHCVRWLHTAAIVEISALPVPV